MPPYKTILSAIAIALTLIAFMPYISTTLKGTTKPHVFSWVIWGITTFIVFLAQLNDHGGVGAWPIGFSGVITGCIACLAYAKRGDISITRSDFLIFAVALSVLPLWYILQSPLWAVVVLTAIDCLGFIPTARKLYHAPHSEPLSFMALFFVRNVLVILALEHYSVTTVLFPATIAVACLSVTALMVIRRRGLER